MRCRKRGKHIRDIYGLRGLWSEIFSSDVSAWNTRWSATDTEKTEWHKACGYSYLIMWTTVKSDGEVVGSKVYRGKNAMGNVLNNVLQEEVVIREILATPKSLAMTAESWKNAKTRRNAAQNLCFMKATKTL